MIVSSSHAPVKTIANMQIKEYLKNKKLSGDLIKIDGEHGSMKFTEGVRVYYIVSGRGWFMINQEETPVGAGDVVYIESNTPYDFRGKMDLFLVCSPAFDPSFDVSLDD